jgi:hypothetical protein
LWIDFEKVMEAFLIARKMKAAARVTGRGLLTARVYF